MLVEGVNYCISWKTFKRGTSIFLPCLDPVRARGEVAPVLKRLQIETISVVKIENGIRGLRIWRL